MRETNRPVRVLMVTNIYPKESNPGQGSFVKSQINSIIKEGVEVEIVSIDAKASPLNYVRGWKEILSASRSGRFDLIHAHYGFSGLVARMQFKLPVMVSFLGDDILGTPDEKGNRLPASILFVLFNQILSFFIQSVIVKSQEMKHKLLRQNNVFVIPNGVDLKRFRPMTPDRVKKQLSLDISKQYIFFPSDPQNTRKCFLVVKTAVEILKKKGFNVDLITLHSKPQELVPLYMNACDALAMASYWEGSPNVIKEAMACNLPIVSVDVGDVKDIIQDCPGCSIVGRNPREFAAQLEKVLNARRRTQGREYIRHLEIQRVAQRIIGIYRKL